MRLTNILEETLTVSNVTGTSSTDAISMLGGAVFSAQCVVTVDTPANKAFASTDVSVANDTITIAANGFTTGLKVQATTSGALPTGMATSTDYFIILVDANTVKVASSLANALAGTAIDLTGAGSGNSSLNPVALAGGAVKLQKSNDGLNWSDEGSSTSVAATGVYWLEKVDPSGAQMRVTSVVTAGRMSLSIPTILKGPN